MSLIVAKKSEGSVLILSDTKLTYSKGSQFNKNNSHPSDSTIKALIVHSSLVVCFAGQKHFAEQAVSRFEENLSLLNLRKFLLSLHLESNAQTEFLAVSTDPLTLFEFKQGNANEVGQSWIGSAQAFEKYQGYLLGALKPKNTGSVSIKMELQSNDKHPDFFQKMSTAFDCVIDDDEIPEVDGFKVKVGIENGKFKYLPYVHSYRSSPLEFKVPSRPGVYYQDLGHAPSSAGGYTVNFFNSSPDFLTLGMHIQQGNLGIVFRRAPNSLFTGEIISNIDEYDFSEWAENKFGLSSCAFTQIVRLKFQKEGDAHFQKHAFKEAIESYQKGLRHSDVKPKAQFFYKIAVCYLNLRDIEKSLVNFQDAINLDNALQKPAFEAIEKYRARFHK